ncbi:hypothetical protein [Thiosulfativibrio zosterae]|uniref:Uncharacterized protein n=1 Tax=Thiosulfativibrio zosterae TaxID=2675053 RepID=A0A6F8PPE2_9GAMM|nr:hypothetical protein [Thiosulfativibrio zosterae]BBP43983.1 hypothetical protein THMIRHAT_17290 [Thiosulfativibrio zosterae]
MLFANRPEDPNDHVLIVLGHHGHPTFKTISTDETYLNSLGEKMVANKHSQYIRHKVVSSHNVFTLTNPDYTFDQAVDQIIRDLILHKIHTKM